MISVGTNVRDMADSLRKAPVRYLYDAIRNPKPAIAARIRQLRIVRQLDPKQYAILKSQLPYFVCAIFNPAYRRTDNFAYTEYFILDLDKIAQKGLVLADLRRRLAADARVMMLFISPGGDGLKLMMRLSERCYDASLYKVFYRLFLNSFSAQYGLEQVADTKTCDVARACFISVDPDAHFRPDSEPVDLKAFINAADNVQQALDLKREVEKSAPRGDGEPSRPKDPDRDTMDKIRRTLNPNARAVRQKAPAYVPAQLESVMADLARYVEDRGVQLAETVNISYGKKLRFKLGHKQAEINLFYGKRGFSVVVSPRTGTDAEMNRLMAEVLDTFLAENC